MMLKGFNKEINIRKIRKMEDKINELVDDENFKSKIHSILENIIETSTCDVFKNAVQGTYKMDDAFFTATVILENNHIAFKINRENENHCGEWEITPSGASYIKYQNKETTQYNLDEMTSYDIKSEKVIETFDTNGIQQFSYVETGHENYCIMKDTGKKIMNDPSPFENYNEKEYSWRTTDNFILKKCIKKYNLSKKDIDNVLVKDEDYVLIGVNTCPSHKKIPLGGYFYGYDEALMDLYSKGIIGGSDIWENASDHYQKCFKM